MTTSLARARARSSFVIVAVVVAVAFAVALACEEVAAQEIDPDAPVDPADASSSSSSSSASSDAQTKQDSVDDPYPDERFEEVSAPLLDPADASHADVAKLRAMRGKQVELVLVDSKRRRGGILNVDDERLVLVTDGGERVQIAVASIVSWRLLDDASVAQLPRTDRARANKPAPDRRANAFGVAAGAGLCTCAGWGAGGIAAFPLFTVYNNPTAGIFALVCAPICCAGTGASVGYFFSAEDLNVEPAVFWLAGAASGGALAGIMLGGLAGAALGNPSFALAGGVVGASVGAVVTSHVTAQELGLARE